MRKLFTLLLAIIMTSTFMTAFPVSADSATFLYVAPNGADSGVGSESAPFATLSAATKAAQKISGTVVINLREGTYPVPETLALTSADNDLVIRAYPGEKVSFDGGTKLPYSSFKPASEDFTAKLLTKSAKSKVVQVNLKDLGITDLGSIKPQGFFSNVDDQGYAPILTYNDQYLPIAQYPNGGDYLKTADIKEDGSKSGKVMGNLNEIRYTITDKRYKSWSPDDEVWAIAFYRHDWADATVPVKFNTENDTITSYTGNGYYAVSDRRVKFFNIPEELDAAGEWYIDKATSILYTILPEGFKSGDNLVFSSCDVPFITIDGASNIYVQGIRFANSLSNAITVTNSKNVVFDGVEATGTGNYAFKFEQCTDSGIKNSYIHDTGATGITMTCGDRKTLTPGNCFITNCHIERVTNYKKTYAPGISIGGVANTISHNEIHDTPHFAISYGGNDQIIEYNNIYDVCKDTADSGAIYTGRNWTTRGNIIRYNYFHDMKMIDTTTGMEMQAVYLDDCHAATSVYSNVFYKCDSVALYGGGRYNTFVNNLMLECKKPFVMDNRGLNWRSYTNPKEMGIYDVPYNEGIWKEKYPELANILNDEPNVPKHNIIKDNVMYNTPDMDIAKEVIDYGTVENNITVKNTTAFTNYNGKDFSVKADSEIMKKIPGFEVWDFKAIGRQEYTIEDKWTDNGSVSEEPANPSTDEIKIVLNGSNLKFDVAPTIINDRTMVPLRAIFEALGAEVSWDDATKTVTATKGDTTIVMQIGNDKMTKKSEDIRLDSSPVKVEEIKLDSAPAIIESRTLVPVRAIAESFGSKVGWDAETKTVTIDD